MALLYEIELDLICKFGNVHSLAIIVHQGSLLVVEKHIGVFRQEFFGAYE